MSLVQRGQNVCSISTVVSSCHAHRSLARSTHITRSYRGPTLLVSERTAWHVDTSGISTKKGTGGRESTLQEDWTTSTSRLAEAIWPHCTSANIESREESRKTIINKALTSIWQKNRIEEIWYNDHQSQDVDGEGTSDTDKKVEIDVKPEWTITKVKEKVEEKAGIPPAQQRLIYGGKAMGDDKQIEEFKLQGGSVIHLVLALRGGL